MPARAFDSTALLSVWEDGFGRSLPDRAIRLLDAARPRDGGWSDATVGQRDRALIGLRRDLFGARFDAEAACPGCGERLEFSFRTEDIVTLEAPTQADHLSIPVPDGAINCRVPTAGDLLDCPDRQTLLARCIGPTQPLTESAAAAVSEAIRRADPIAEIQLQMTCPGCGRTWHALLDIVSFLWGEVEDWARRLLLEVHYLASAYGWSEAEIVAMSPRRRRTYLEMGGVA